MSEYIITNATAADADFISDAIMTAVGHDLCANMGGGEENLHLVHDIFAALAARTDSQYSYLNTLIAWDAEGKHAGAAISYDGAHLHRLRRPFIDAANRLLHWDITEEDMTDETSPDEIYLDTLMVVPEHRRQGLASALIQAVAEKHRSKAKPIGLLVDYSNPNAKRLYKKMGFKKVGDRPFAGEMMEHMQKF